MLKFNFFVILLSMKMFLLLLSLLDLEQKTVCCPLIHDQALSDPARHANRPQLLKDTSHSHFHTTPPLHPHHHPPPPPSSRLTSTAAELLLKLADGPAEDVAGQKD